MTFRKSPRTLAVLLCLAAPAGAQSATALATARIEFREALSQEAAGDWAGALAKMESVARVKLTPQVRYHIARCKDHLGRYTEALGDYRLAEYEAQKVSAAELPEITRARQDLEARVPKLFVELPASAAGASVELDGVELGATQIAVEIPVNPGAHRIVAKLGKRRWGRTFKARDGKSSRIELAPPAQPVDHDATTVDPAARPAPAASGGSGALPWVAAGVGVAGLVGTGAFYALHAGAESDLDATCHGSVCPESMRDTHDKSKLYGTLTGVSLAVGVVGIGTATVLWLSHGGSPEKDAVRARVGVDAHVTPGWRGVSVRGSF